MDELNLFRGDTVLLAEVVGAKSRTQTRGWRFEQRGEAPRICPETFRILHLTDVFFQ